MAHIKRKPVDQYPSWIKVPKTFNKTLANRIHQSLKEFYTMTKWDLFR